MFHPSLLQDQPRVHPLGGDTVLPVPAVTTEMKITCRTSAHLNSTRDGVVPMSRIRAEYHSGDVSVTSRGSLTLIDQWITEWRRLDVRPIPSSRDPRELLLRRGRLTTHQWSRLSAGAEHVEDAAFDARGGKLTLASVFSTLESYHKQPVMRKDRASAHVISGQVRVAMC